MAIDKRKVLQTALAYTQQGRWDKAIAEYQAILKADPNDLTIYNTLGDLYARVGNTAEAIATYTKLGDLYRTDGLAVKAIAVYKKIIKLDPANMNPYLVCADLYAEQGLVGEARTTLVSVAERYGQEGNARKALEVYQKIANLDPDNYGIAIKLAEMMAREGLKAEALEQFGRAAQAALTAGQAAEAQRAFRRMLQLDPRSTEAGLALGRMALEAGQAAEAVKHLQTVAAAAPEIEVLQLLGDAHLKAGRPAEAEAVLRQAVAAAPEAAGLRLRLAQVLGALGRAPEAGEEIRPVLEALLGEGKGGEALEALEGLATGAPEDRHLRQTLADVYRQVGREAAARETYLAAAGLCEAQGAPDEAAVIYRTLLEMDPADAEAGGRLEALAPGESREAAAPTAPTGGGRGSMQITLGEDLAKELGFGEEEAEPVYELTPDEEPAASLELEGPGVPALELEGSGAALGAEPGEGLALELEGSEGGPAALEFSPEPVTPPVEPVAREPGMLFELPAEAAGPPPSDLMLSVEGPPADSALSTAGTAEARPGLVVQAPGPPGGEPSAADASALGEQLAEVDVFLKYGLTEKAVTYLEQAVTKAPEFLPARERLKRLYEDLGRAAQAAAQAVELARRFRQEGDRPRAEAELRNALRLDPANAVARGELATLEGPPAAPAVRPAEEVTGEGIETLPEELRDLLDEDEAGLEVAEAGAPDPSLTEDLAEAAFYAEQGMTAEAREVYARLLARDPENAEVRRRLAALDQAAPSAEPLEIVIPEDRDGEQPAGTAAGPAGGLPVLEEAPGEVVGDEQLQGLLEEVHEEEAKIDWQLDRPSGQDVEAVFRVERGGSEPAEGGFVDLGAELEQELAEPEPPPAPEPAMAEGTILEEILQEFQKGVREHLDEQDYETHYNLGIAYKEMDLYDEAIEELRLGGRGPALALSCGDLIGLCLLAKGRPDLAVQEFNLTLALTGFPAEEYRGLKYNLAAALQASGDLPRARDILRGLVVEDPEFRDAKTRLAELEGTIKAGGPASPAAPARRAPEGEPPAQPERTRRDRISFI